MPAFTTRFDTPLVNALDELAGKHGLSRNAFLERLAEEAVRWGFVPIRPGEGLQAVAPGGGSSSLIQEHHFVSAGHANLSGDELAAFQQAKALADQGLWAQAKLTLVEAGFTVNSVLRGQAI